jgi:hypothetical protein
MNPWKIGLVTQTARSLCQKENIKEKHRKPEKEETRKMRDRSSSSGGTSSKLKKTMLMMLFISLAMTCSEVENIHMMPYGG